MNALGGRGILVDLVDAALDLTGTSPVFELKVLAWEATEIDDPENAGVRRTRRALIDSSRKDTTGVPRSALLRHVRIRPRI